jgi:transposase
VPTTDLPRAPGPVRYDQPNALRADAGFDRSLQGLCPPYHAAGLGRESIPPGVSCRLRFVGSVEGLEAQHAIAWRCAPRTAATPAHSRLRRSRQRLPLDVHERLFLHGLASAQDKTRRRGKTVAVAATTRQANAALRSLSRKDSGADSKAYLRRRRAEQGVDNPTAEDLGRFDRDRPKKGPNEEWPAPADPDSRIAKRKDRRRHRAYRAEQVVERDWAFVVAAPVDTADPPGPATLGDRLLAAPGNLGWAGSDQEIEAAVAAKGYHKAPPRAACQPGNRRTYIAEPKRKKRRGKGPPAAHRRRIGRSGGGSRGRGASGCRSEAAWSSSGVWRPSARRAACGGGGWAAWRT